MDGLVVEGSGGSLALAGRMIEYIVLAGDVDLTLLCIGHILFYFSTTCQGRVAGGLTFIGAISSATVGAHGLVALG